MDNLLKCGDLKDKNGDLTCCAFCGVEGLLLTEYKYGIPGENKKHDLCNVCASIVDTDIISELSHPDRKVAMLISRQTHIIRSLIIR